jgi:hypothetical protein
MGSNINKFLKVGNKQDVELLKSKFFTPEYVKMEAMIKTAIEKNKEGGFDISPKVWWDSASNNLDALKASQDAIMDRVVEEAKSEKTSALVQLIVAVVVTFAILGLLLAISFATSKSIEESIKQLLTGFNPHFAIEIPAHKIFL